MEVILNTAYSFCQLGQRDNQEDYRYPDKDIIEENQRFFVVCDGVGGCEKGEVASKTVCLSVCKSLSKIDLENVTFGKEEFSAMLEKVYEDLNKAANGQGNGMATTLAFVCFHKEGCSIVHIGDSRIYQVRPGEGIIFRSDDHSLVNSLVHSGAISPEQGENHPQSNVILRCVEPLAEGEQPNMVSWYMTKDIQEGDYFFLCSDGVSNQLDDDMLEKILVCSDSDVEKMRQIASLCFGSVDNNTAILVPIALVEGVVVDEVKEDLATTHRLPSCYSVSSEIQIENTNLSKGLFAVVHKFVNKFIRSCARHG